MSRRWKTCIAIIQFSSSFLIYAPRRGGRGRNDVPFPYNRVVRVTLSRGRRLYFLASSEISTVRYDPLTPFPLHALIVHHQLEKDYPYLCNP